MEQMLAHLTSASAQAAAASLVSGHHGTQVYAPAYMLAQLCTLFRYSLLSACLGDHPQPTLYSAPCSPPARKTSAPSAMLTPSLLCSSPVAISPASKWVPWI